MKYKKEILRIARLIMSATAEKEVEKIMKILLKGTPFSHKVHSVGGYIRDELLGLESKDLDIVVEMRGGAEKLTKYLGEILNKNEKGTTSTPRQMGKGYPIWQLTFKKNINWKGKKFRTRGAIIEFADTQKETFPEEESRQREVEYGTLEEDVKRRDFSVNMLLRDLTNGEIVDLTGISKNDIKKGILRGHPEVPMDKPFREDPLRIMRLVRFQAKYDWSIPLPVLKAAKRNAKRIEIIYSERIMGELKKIMKYGKLGKAIKLMKIIGVLKYVFPEVEAMKGVQQDKKHHAEGTVFKHVMLVLKNAKPTIEHQLAALLHDIGKPATQEIIGERITFHGHEDVGADIAEAILRRLKFETDVIKKVRSIVENHMRPHMIQNEIQKLEAKGKKKGIEKLLRKFIRKIGDELMDTLIDMAEADALGKLPPDNYIPELMERIRKIKESPLPVKKKAVLDGNELMELLDLKAGPKVGEVTRYLLELQDNFASEGVDLTKEKAKVEILKKFEIQR